MSCYVDKSFHAHFFGSVILKPDIDRSWNKNLEIYEGQNVLRGMITISKFYEE